MMVPIILSFTVGYIVLIERSRFLLKQRSGVPPQGIKGLMDTGKFADALALINRPSTTDFRILAAAPTN